jgi:hypothetical protein
LSLSEGVAVKMLTRTELSETAMRLYNYCEYPAVRYKILFTLLDKPYEDKKLQGLRPDFLGSDIVEELFQTQDIIGGWGRLQSKDYSAKDKFPTSLTAINRCLYIGLTLEDRDILIRAKEYLEDFLLGTSRERQRNTNERVIPWHSATVCNALESIQPYNPLCDRTYNEWLYILTRSFESGEYSYERERAAQHEVFYTREDKLAPMQTELLLKRKTEVLPELGEAMLRHFGAYAYHHGHFWQNCPALLPKQFVYNKTRRWFYSFNYINQFHSSAIYLADSAEWLIANMNSDGLWDWGTQTKDPWGYFGYFSTTHNSRYNRIVDCSMEILCFLKRYLDQND